MSEQSDLKRIWMFLAMGIPPGGTPQFKLWQEEVKGLGEDAPRIFIQALKEGTETEQYTAVVGLRYLGYESHGDGYGSKMVYKYKPPGSSEWTTVVPLFPPDDADLWSDLHRR